MSEAFISEIRIMAFSFAPRNWALCNGQLLPINQNQALFSLLGTTYGGNGTTVFALPNLQGRAPIHVGSGFAQGQSGGAVSHTLSAAEMPAHTHSVSATSASATAATGPAGAIPAVAAHAPYRSGSVQLTAMKAAAVQSVGGNQPHNNLQPFLALNFCIALTGIFPSRN